MDVLEAAYWVAHDYKLDMPVHGQSKSGVPALAAKMGRNAGTLFNQLNLSCETHSLGLGTAVEMTVITGDLRILEAFAATCDCAVFSLKGMTRVSDTALLELVAKWMTEQGEFFERFNQTLVCGEVTAADFKETKKEAMDVVQAILELVNRLSQLVVVES